MFLRISDGVSSVVGGFLILLTLGTFYTIGNMSNYIVSYLRNCCQPDLANASTIWITSIFLFGMGVTMPIGGMMVKKIGTNYTSAIGCLIFTVSTAATYFTIQKSFFLVILTYGIIPALGCGISYMPPLINGIKWFPNHKGLISGITVGGFGLGSLVFNQVQVYYINPYNIVPVNTTYHTRAEVLERVPKMYVISGVIYGVLQVMGVVLIKNFEENNEIIKDNSEAKEAKVMSYTVKEAVKSPNFYILWIIITCGIQIISFMSAFWKVFGLRFIQDDQFLTTIGSVSAIANAAGRVGWGKTMDTIGFKKSAIIIYALLGFLLFTFELTKYFGRIFYSFWLIAIFITFSGNLSIFPAEVAQLFGPENANTLYGLLFIAAITTGIFLTIITQYMIDNFGWFSILAVHGFILFIGLVITVLFFKDQKKIEKDKQAE